MAEAANDPARGLADVAARYRLRLHGQRFRGALGAQRARHAGGALEFLDFRDYVPGDDVRHVDWHGYARNEQLRVRQFEAEVSPRVDVVVDGSPSMTVTREKADATRALARAFVAWARHDGAPGRLFELGGDALDAESFAPGGGVAAPALPRLPLRSGGVRVLVTDALWPESPRAVVHGLAAGASHFVCVQLLDPWELLPRAGDALTLVDCETGQRLERRLDAAQLAGYRERLQRLHDELRATVLGAGGVFAQLAAAPLAVMCERDLLAAGVLELA
jgi:hypothetical protein